MERSGPVAVCDTRVAGTLRLERSEMIERLALSAADRPTRGPSERASAFLEGMFVCDMSTETYIHLAQLPPGRHSDFLLSVPEIVGERLPTSARQMISLGLLHHARA